MLKYKPIEFFALQNNSFENVREGIEFAVEVMKSNEMMKAFYWASTTINSMEDAHYLVDSIINHLSIKTICLGVCFQGGCIGYDVLCSLLTSDKGFKHIDFDNSNIRTGGGTELPDYLAINPPLKKLYLNHNNLNDEDAVLIARAVKQNTNLKVLCLGLDGNNITEVGVKALREAIYNPESLNSVADCNHTCKVRGINLSTPKRNRAWMIYRLLSVRNREGSNVYH